MPLDLLGKIMALLCAVVWAGAVILFKLAGDRIRPLALNLYKTALTVTILLPLLLLREIPLIPAGCPGRHWLAIMASGILGIAGLRHPVLRLPEPPGGRHDRHRRLPSTPPSS